MHRVTHCVGASTPGSARPVEKDRTRSWPLWGSQSCTPGWIGEYSRLSTFEPPASALVTSSVAVLQVTGRPSVLGASPRREAPQLSGESVGVQVQIIGCRSPLPHIDRARHLSKTGLDAGDLCHRRFCLPTPATGSVPVSYHRFCQATGSGRLPLPGDYQTSCNREGLIAQQICREHALICTDGALAHRQAGRAGILERTRGGRTREGRRGRHPVGGFKLWIEVVDCGAGGPSSGLV